jgi:hypothetical protein
MAEAGSEAEAAADRLEAALERIAALAPRLPEGSSSAVGSSSTAPEVAERLDALIAHLREALDGPPG